MLKLSKSKIAAITILLVPAFFWGMEIIHFEYYKSIYIHINKNEIDNLSFNRKKSYTDGGKYVCFRSSDNAGDYWHCDINNHQDMIYHRDIIFGFSLNYFCAFKPDGTVASVYKRLIIPNFSP